MLNTSQAKDEEKESMSMSTSNRTNTGDHFSTGETISAMATPGGGAVNKGGIRGRGGGVDFDGDAADGDGDDEDDDDGERKKILIWNTDRPPDDDPVS